MKNIELYGKQNDKSTQDVIRLFHIEKLSYFFHDLEFSDAAKAQFKQRLQGIKKYPQIIVDGKRIGNLENFKKFLQDQKEAKLNEAS